MTKWGVDNLGLLANCNDCESTFSDLNEVLYISALENWLKTIVTDKKHERDRFRSDLVASYDIESNSYFLTMIRLFSQYGSTNRSSTVKPRENVHPNAELTADDLTLLTVSNLEVAFVERSVHSGVCL